MIQIKTISINSMIGIGVLTAIMTAFEPQTAAAQTHQFANVVNPDVPEHLTFADKTITIGPHSDFAERFDRELTSMIYTHGNTLLVMKRANKYFPEMLPILKRNNIPEDMIYIACIESFLNPTAVSGTKAAGMWQFMPSTAKQYGLEVNDYVDERFNVALSTEAACRYFNDAYAKYGNWETVAAAYNGGMGRISNAIEAQGEHSAYNLYLAEETMRYIYRLLAMKTIMTNPEAYGYNLRQSQKYQPESTKQIVVDYPVAGWIDWARQQGITYLQLRQSNPWIRSSSLPNPTGKTYTVNVPQSSIEIK